MRIKKKISQHRRDFYAIYECEHCGHETRKKPGYDDFYFHDVVIPGMTCAACGSVAGPLAPRSTPDVPEGLVL